MKIVLRDRQKTGTTTPASFWIRPPFSLRRQPIWPLACGLLGLCVLGFAGAGLYLYASARPGINAPEAPVWQAPPAGPGAGAEITGDPPPDTGIAEVPWDALAQAALAAAVETPTATEAPRRVTLDTGPPSASADGAMAAVSRLATALAAPGVSRLPGPAHVETAVPTRPPAAPPDPARGSAQAVAPASPTPAQSKPAQPPASVASGAASGNLPAMPGAPPVVVVFTTSGGKVYRRVVYANPAGSGLPSAGQHPAPTTPVPAKPTAAPANMAGAAHPSTGTVIATRHAGGWVMRVMPARPRVPIGGKTPAGPGGSAP
jgi:hypothetical protein